MQQITEAAIEAADIFGGQIAAKDIQEMLENAQPSILAEEFAPLRARFVKAVSELRDKVRDAGSDMRADEMARLNGKAEGIRLAMSYLDELIRSL